MASTEDPPEIGRLEHVDYESYPSSEEYSPKKSTKTTTSTMQKGPRKEVSKTDIPLINYDEDVSEVKTSDVRNTPPNQAASDLDKRLKKMKTKSTTKKYTGVELALIGKQCSTKLPPASAVQAMFLYEYERKAEDEKFFHSRMFQLRREEEAATLERAKAAETIQALEARVKQLEKTTASRDREASDRLTKSSTRIKATQETLDQHMTNINDLSTKLADVTTDMQALQTAVTSNTTEAISPTTIADHANALAALQTDVLNLFEDRDGMITLVTDTRARVTKLEDNVRALTLQNAAIKPPSSVQPHRLPMATSYGEKFDLAVPKGMAHVSLKAETNGRKANSVI